jgi:cell wall-associated NlpC family hydrolase
MLLLLACAAPAVPVVPEPAPLVLEAPSPLVDAARAYLGRPYRFGGRGERLDCMGLVFLAWSDVTGSPWRRLSVMPTELVARGQLGAPVPGADGVREVELSRLQPGDVLYFLAAVENPAEPPLVALDGVPVWVWHMGLYSGRGAFIASDPVRGRVVEAPLTLRGYAALFATRPGT